MTHTAKASKSKASLTKIFSTFAKRALSDFPQLTDKFSVYNLPTNKVYGSYDDTKRNAVKYHKTFIKLHQKAGDVPPAFSMTIKGNHSISVVENISNDEVSQHLEHELGHVVAPGGMEQGRLGKRSSVFRECVAEAFLFLRLQQRTQTMQPLLDKESRIAAENFVMYVDSSHYYVPVLQELEGLSARHDLSGMNLTPLQTANMAYRLSLLYAPSNKAIHELQHIFRPVVEEFMDTGDVHPEIYKKCVKIMFKDHKEYSSMAFTAGKLLLESFSQDKSLKDFKGEFWDSVRNKIKERPLQQEAETPEQRLAHEARDMMVLGRFDKTPDKKISPTTYESKQNMAYLQRAQDAYTGLCYLQETGKKIPGSNCGSLSAQEAAALDQDKIIALACEIANKITPSVNKIALNQNSPLSG